MSSRLIIDGNSVYEIDEECERKRYGGRVYGQKTGKTERHCGSQISRTEGKQK